MNYRIITSDKKKYVVHAQSAAQAIEEARWMWRGRKVIECYSGIKENDAELIRQMDRDARPIVGFINHEVPDHEPVGQDEIRPKKPFLIPASDASIPMFDDKLIENESRKAKEKFNQ